MLRVKFVRMRCPHCGREFMGWVNARVYDNIKCTACGQWFITKPQVSEKKKLDEMISA